MNTDIWVLLHRSNIYCYVKADEQIDLEQLKAKIVASVLLENPKMEFPPVWEQQNAYNWVLGDTGWRLHRVLHATGSE